MKVTLAKEILGQSLMSQNNLRVRCILKIWLYVTEGKMHFEDRIRKFLVTEGNITDSVGRIVWTTDFIYSGLSKIFWKEKKIPKWETPHIHLYGKQTF